MKPYTELSSDFGFIVIEGVNLFRPILILTHGYVPSFNSYTDRIAQFHDPHQQNILYFA